MVTEPDNNKFRDLRQRAQSFIASDLETTDLSHADVRKLVHELDTYQIELELQNEDLLNVQRELDRSRRRYSDLYDFAPIGYFTISDKGMIVEANLTAGALLGTPRGQLLNRPLSDFLFADDQDVYYKRRKKLLDTGQQQSYELRLQKSDGSHFYALVVTTADSTGCDLPGHFRVTVQDISVRKQEELAKLRHIKDRYRAIVMDQNDLICRCDPQGRMTFVNDAWCRCFGLSHQEVLGSRFLPPVHADDLPLVREYLNSLTRQQPDRTIEYRVVLPDGHIHWQQWCSRAIYDQEGRLLEYQSVGRDITKRKATEEQLRKESRLRQLFLDALPCIAMLLEYDSRRIVAANRAAVTAGAAPGQQCFATWAQRGTPCTWCLAPRLWAESAPQNGQFWALGTYWDAYWVPVGEGLYLHYIFDITEKHKSEEALKQAYDELEQRVVERTLELQQSHAQLLHSEKLAAVGNLSASIAHEFNNPLQSVSTILKGLEQYASLDKKEAELISLALEECQRMKSLIANLRDFFQPTSGEISRVDLHATLDALLLISKKDFHLRKIRVVRKYGDNVATIRAVADQLKQVFLNLFNNAADACDGGGVITITTEAIDQKNIVIHIADDGVGIDPINMAHIFEPFFTTKPALKGTGLGLSVSYGIIKKHGGRIEVQSERGRGATFSVYLPAESVGDEQ